MSRLEKMSDRDYIDRARRNSGSRLAAVLPLLVMAVYLYGVRPLLLCAAALLTAVLCDGFAALLRRRPLDANDPSSLLFAVLLVCLMPASVSYVIVVLSTAVAILVGKHLFGGFGSYPFHPTALGYVAAVVSWPTQMLTFPAPFSALGLENTLTVVPAEAPAATLKLAGLPNVSFVNILLGNFAGPLGVTASLVVAACGLMLLAVRRFDLSMPLSFFAVCALVVWLVPRVPGAARTEVLRMELLGCGLAFGAVFLLPDEITAPRGLLARILYGALVGLITMIFEYNGSYPYGICFGILCGNALSGFLEKIGAFVRRKNRALFSAHGKKPGEGGAQAV